MRAALILALLAAPVSAQAPPCYPMLVIEWLADNHGQSPAVRLTTEAGNAVVVWTNTRTSTWTLTVTRSDGLTCLLSSGIGIETMAASLLPNI